MLVTSLFIAVYEDVCMREEEGDQVWMWRAPQSGAGSSQVSSSPLLSLTKGKQNFLLASSSGSGENVWEMQHNFTYCNHSTRFYSLKTFEQ